LEDGGGQSFGSAKSGIDWSNYSVLITGHSLGGTIASLMAPWLASLILDQTPRTDPLPSQILAVTFAAFAAGKQQFADYLNNSSQYQPNINVNDIEPHVWATSGAYSVDYIYGTFPLPGPPIPDYIKVGLGVKVATIPKNFTYVQTNEPNTFAGTILPAPRFSQCPGGAATHSSMGMGSWPATLLRLQCELHLKRMLRTKWHGMPQVLTAKDNL
jgi:hypothetical protein